MNGGAGGLTPRQAVRTNQKNQVSLDIGTIINIVQLNEKTEQTQDANQMKAVTDERHRILPASTRAAAEDTDLRETNRSEHQRSVAPAS